MEGGSARARNKIQSLRLSGLRGGEGDAWRGETNLARASAEFFISLLR
jgi:hypothetical protein